MHDLQHSRAGIAAASFNFALSAYPVWLKFISDICDKRMASRFLRSVKYLDGTPTRRNDNAIRVADPLPLILSEHLITHGPVGGFILEQIGMKLRGDFRRQEVGEAFHAAPWNG